MTGAFATTESLGILQWGFHIRFTNLAIISCQ